MSIIVAFLQNMWIQPNRVEYVRKHYADPIGEERERLIAYALFAGCLTGRRLKKAFGENLCDQIIWQEANPFVADNPRDYHPPDADHIRAVLAKHSPQVVVCLTARGEAQIRELAKGCLFIPCVHPACRLADVMARLTAARDQILNFRPVPEPVH